MIPEQVLPRWKNLIKSEKLFPDHSEYEFARGLEGEFYITVVWLLFKGNHPHKKSKVIHITIQPGAFRNYLDCKEDKRKSADEKLIGIVKEKYKVFDPNHDKPPWSTAPIEEWKIRHSDLFQEK